MRHEDVVDGFERCTLPAGAFRHRDHVIVAFHYLRGMVPADALARFARNARRFAEHHGASGKYHETITWAFIALINERMERTGRDVEWETFISANPDLLDKRVLERFYEPHLLGSDLARRAFVLPRGR